MELFGDFQLFDSQLPVSQLLVGALKPQYQILIALPILLVTCSLCALFGIAAIRNQVAYTRYGGVVRGGMAVAQGVILLVVSFCSGCAFLGLLASVLGTFGMLWHVSPASKLVPIGPELRTDRTAEMRDLVNEMEREFQKTLEEQRRRAAASTPPRPPARDLNDSKANPIPNPVQSRRTNPPATSSTSPSAKTDRPSVQRGLFETGEEERKVNTVSEPADVPNPEFAKRSFPQFQYDSSGSRKSSYIGAEEGMDFESSGPPGSVLVGMRVGADADGGVGTLQPIYLLQDKYIFGTRTGDTSLRTHLLLADPGYVVGTVLVSSDQYLQSLQLRFVKLDAAKAAKDVFQQYDSRKIGRTVGSIKELDPKDWHIVGVFGKSSSTKVYGLGLAAVQITPSVKPAEFRSWRSRDGQYSVEARLQSFQNGTATLEKRDGSTVDVPTDTLSDEDQAYLRSR